MSATVNHNSLKMNTFYLRIITLKSLSNSNTKSEKTFAIYLSY